VKIFQQMVSATFSVPLHKLNAGFIDKIKAFIGHEEDEPNLLISVLPKLEPAQPGESGGKHLNKLERSIEEIKKGEAISFDSIEDFETFVAWYSAADDDFESHMSDDQFNALGEAIKMTHDENNLIPQPEAKKLVVQWLNQKLSNG